MSESRNSIQCWYKVTTETRHSSRAASNCDSHPRSGFLLVINKIYRTLVLPQDTTLSSDNHSQNIKSDTKFPATVSAARRKEEGLMVPSCADRNIGISMSTPHERPNNKVNTEGKLLYCLCNPRCDVYVAKGIETLTISDCILVYKAIFS